MIPLGRGFQFTTGMPRIPKHRAPNHHLTITGPKRCVSICSKVFVRGGSGSLCAMFQSLAFLCFWSAQKNNFCKHDVLSHRISVFFPTFLDNPGLWVCQSLVALPLDSKIVAVTRRILRAGNVFHPIPSPGQIWGSFGSIFLRSHMGGIFTLGEKGFAAVLSSIQNHRALLKTVPHSHDEVQHIASPSSLVQLLESIRHKKYQKRKCNINPGFS